MSDEITRMVERPALERLKKPARGKVGEPIPTGLGPTLPEMPAADSEVERLRREVAALTRERDQLRGQAPALSPAERMALPKQCYRVSLEGARVRLAVFVVRLREPLSIAQPEAQAKRYQELAARQQEGQLPDGEYPAVELYLQGEQDYQAAAWRRYCQEHQLLPSDRQHFQVRGEGRGQSDSLDVLAVSAGDAEQCYRRFNGVTGTARKFRIEALDAV